MGSDCLAAKMKQVNSIIFRLFPISDGAEYDGAFN